MVSHSPLGQHAVVLGGGIAGLLTARVLKQRSHRTYDGKDDEGNKTE